MNAYTGDPRVTDHGHGHYEVSHRPGGVPTGCVQRRCGGVFVAIVDGADPNPPQFASADEAIRSLIGDPR
ncbi:hypothetical protein [Actinoplanes sp. URMC 104]|uniref:hypothetical protein n=1 Tax=Actinoplanes sp. URMC 104 TaxID=3423409 RepID=UPI003F1E2B65